MEEPSGWCHLDAVEPAALARTLWAWRAVHPGCGVLALLPEGAVADVPTVQAACAALEVPLLGAVFPRLIREGGFAPRGALLVRLDAPPPHGLVDGLREGPTACAARVHAALEPHLARGAPAGALFLLCDATTPRVDGVLEALHDRLGRAVTYLGVMAGSETFRPMPCVFDGRRLVGDALLWLLLPPGTPAVVDHDYDAPPGAGVATSARGDRVFTVDDRPAYDFYRDRLAEQHRVELTPENFYRLAVEFPLGIERPDGQLLVRMPVALEEGGAIRVIGEVPERAVLVTCRAPPPRFGEAGRALARRLRVEGIGGDMLLFYCAGRRLRLGSESDADLRALLGASGARAAGAITLGEIGGAAAGAGPVFHNGALVAVGWPGGRGTVKKSSPGP